MSKNTPEGSVEELPWLADFPLDEGGVSAILKHQFPELPLNSVKFLSEGWESRAFEVNGDWIFRFPKRKEVFDSMKTEVEVLPRIASVLPLRVPNFEFVGKAEDPCLYGFSGYRKLPGVPICNVSDDNLDRHSLQRRLGEFLSVLHGIETVKPGEVAPGRTILGTYERSVNAIQNMGELAPVALVTKAAQFLKAQSEIPEYSGPGCLLHNDLYCEHILIEGESVSAVLDWGDMAWGDPAVDFAGLWAWFGKDFAEGLLTFYHHPVDSQFMERVEFYAVCYGVFSLFFGLRRPSQKAVANGSRELRLSLGST